MFAWFDQSHCADLFIHHAERLALHTAAQDLMGDVKKVSGKAMLKKPYLPVAEKNAVVIGSLENPAFAQWVKPHLNDCDTLSQEWEGYRIVVDGSFLIVAGSNYLGAMWGVYYLSKNYLGVDPCYLFTLSKPEKKESLEIEDTVIADRPKTYKFRGWFLNDEDLLSDWKDGGGARYIDYPFYDQVAHPHGIEMVLETAVRLGINLIIPASFVDINNPPEENLVRMANTRGLYVTQHHVEPLGVSHFGFENYWREKGMEEQFSFVTNREKVIECWRNSVKKWAKFDNVIWQLGLRGRGDRPAWAHDKAIENSDAAHGALISEALMTQYNIVKEELGHENFLSTATLWMEGTELFHKGLLTFPKGTIIIFADAGLTQMFGKDFFELARMPEYNYGLYYHVAFWGAGPHFVQGTDVRKMQYQYRLAKEKGDTYYSILNVTNVRDVVMCVQANAELIWDMDSFDEEKFLNRYFKNHFDLENGAELMRRHFLAFADYPTTVMKDDFYALWRAEVELKEPVDFKQRVILDGVARAYAFDCLRDIQNQNFTVSDEKHDDSTWIPALEVGLADFEDSYTALCKAYPLVKDEGKAFFRDLMLVQEEIIIQLYHWAHGCASARVALRNGDKHAAIRHLRHAAYAIEKLLEDRRKAEHDEFEDWYRGDRKMNLRGGAKLTHECLAQLRG